MDTGWEADETYTYLKEVLPRFVGDITWLKAPRQMEDLCIHKGMFPSRVRRFCTQQLKVFPMQKYLKQLDDDVVNAVGIRRAESEARSKMLEWEWSDGFDCEVWRPLVNWTEQDVIDIHKQHSCPPNPLYLKGASRVGCWPCIFAKKSEIRFIAEQDPERVIRISKLEERVGQDALLRYEKRGEVMLNPPSFFQARTPGTGECWPIQEVVRWSKTAQGGRQWELFAPPESEAGCVRWGMCELSED